MNLPKKLTLANLPTKIEMLERVSKELGFVNIYLKRDDQTGTEVSGNKVRKLEYAVAEAIDGGCNALITCGAVQSNHARATAAVAAKLGLECHLILRGSDEDVYEGNYFLDGLFGAKIDIVSNDDFNNIDLLLKNKQEELTRQGKKSYILPIGASNGIGGFGYNNALNEILIQEKEMNIHFDAIVTTVGSAGTFAGLLYGNSLANNDAIVYGINISSDKSYFMDETKKIIAEMNAYTGQNLELSSDEISIIDGYAGKGYGLSTKEEIDFIKYIAGLEGVALDPVYTGKAFYGLYQEIKKGTFTHHKNILFIHTGGIFGWKSEQRTFIKD